MYETVRIRNRKVENMGNYVVRRNQIEHIWKVSYIKNGFKFPIFVRGTEDEMRDYLESEMGYVGSYHALTEKEEGAVYELQLTVYLAPRVNPDDDIR